MKKTFENGVHLPQGDDYPKSEGVPLSALKELYKSPYHYWYKYLSGKYVRKPPAPSLLKGEVMHCRLLEPDAYYERYAEPLVLPDMPEKLLLKNVGKEAFEQNKLDLAQASQEREQIKQEYYQSTENKTILTPDIIDAAKQMTTSMLENEIMGSLMDGALFEHAIYFPHEPTDMQCKVRMDIWNGSIVADVKTVADISYRGFQRDAYKYCYFLQAGMMKRALDYIGVEMQQFWFACVENSEPYGTAMFVLDRDAIEFGENQFDKLMEKLAHHLKTDVWQVQDQGAEVLTLPKWADYE